MVKLGVTFKRLCQENAHLAQENLRLQKELEESESHFMTIVFPVQNKHTSDSNMFRSNYRIYGNGSGEAVAILAQAA